MINSLNDIINLKSLDLESFWSSAAILQSNEQSDLFYLIVGPFKQYNFNQNEIENYLANNQKSHNQKSTHQKFTVPLLYVPDFWDFIKNDSEKCSYLTGSYFFTVSRAELVDYLKTILDSELIKDPLESCIQLKWDDVRDDEFIQQFNWSQKQFAEKNLIKTVPIINQVAEGHFKAIHFIKCLLKLLSEKHFGWIYGFWHENQGFLGLSPELILNWKGSEKKLITSALAGTLKKTTTSALEIKKDIKILNEHQIVVDDIHHILNFKLSNNIISKQNTEVLSLKFLEHLKTDFSCAEVDRIQALELVSSLHPTAALGIYPRNLEKSKEFATFNIQKDRKNFAAPFAMITNESIHCIAAIRNFYFQNNKIIIFSGCGVTSDSQLNLELNELESKRMSVVKMMGLTND